MLSLFPILLSYNLAVPLVFRVAVGLTFIFFGRTNLAEHKTSKLAMFERMGLKSGIVWLWILVAVEVIGGGLLVVGLWTQAAALALSVTLLLGIIVKIKNGDSLPWSVGFLSLLFLITLSLLFLGPGFYGLDLPL